MRTTFTLDDDVAAAVDAVRRSEGVGPSEAVNRLIRRGLAARPDPAPYRHRSVSMQARVDVADIGAILDLLDDRD
jgi:metal-responsive CopG/Arc/MetJ family transcriptional regulator